MGVRREIRGVGGVLVGDVFLGFIFWLCFYNYYLFVTSFVFFVLGVILVFEV